MEILKSGAQQLGIHLTPQQIEQFEIYYRELVSWNERINLTAITDYDEVQIKHFLDSLTVISGMRPADRARPIYVIDVGTGAGLPGIALKIVLPQIRLSLLEATTKKTKFLVHLTDKIGFKDVEIVNARAEEAAHDASYREKFDLALCRAVAKLPTLVELALPFCTLGGYLIAQKKGDIENEVLQSQKAIEVLGGVLSEVKPVELEDLKDNRILVVIDKIRPTPPAYPRRPGIPAKRPLID
jgi:16S rRNA (guanine527-N7)-methyltransferase